jgi:hypothetical protein
MGKKVRSKYTPGFKLEAVRLVKSGRSMSVVSATLGAKIAGDGKLIRSMLFCPKTLPLSTLNNKPRLTPNRKIYRPSNKAILMDFFMQGRSCRNIRPFKHSNSRSQDRA